jgi:hypothetical protein
LYTRLPPIITRIEGEKSQLVEDVHTERVALHKELAALLDSQGMRAIANVAQKLAGGFGVRARGTYQPEKFAEAALQDSRIQHLIQQLPPERRADGRRVVSDVIRTVDCSIELKLYAALRLWLALHISATAVLMTLMFAHVGAVLLWFI